MSLTRRSFLAGLGSVTVGFLFRKQLDAVLDSLERDSAAELAADPISPEQAPSGADIVVQTVSEFRPHRLVVPMELSGDFMLDNVTIGPVSQFAGPVSAVAFDPRAPDAAVSFDAMAPGVSICFRVRYVGTDPNGRVFKAAVLGYDADHRTRILPISSDVPIRA